MIPLILVISGMLVYEMKPPATYSGPGQGLVRIPAVKAHTPFFVFDPGDFDPIPPAKSLADTTIADLVTLPDGTQRARIDLTDKRLEIGSGAGMKAKWKGNPNAPVFDETAPDTLDWVPSFFELMSGVAQPLKADADFSSVVTIGLGDLTSAGQPKDARGKIIPLKFLKISGTNCAISPHGLARFLRLDADGTNLILLLKDKTGTTTLAAGTVVAAPRGPVAMSITNFPSKLTLPPSTTRLDHLEMLFQAAIKNPPTSDKICLPSPPPPGTVTGSSAFCPPMRP
jgi:hypothetical protein